MLYVEEPMPFKDALATKRRKLDRERTAARIERELSQVRAILMEGPVTTKEISEAIGVSSSHSMYSSLLRV